MAQQAVKFGWDHVHLRTTEPEAMAQWFESMLGAQVIRSMQQGKLRIDLKLGGANIFIAPVTPSDGVNAPPVHDEEQRRASATAAEPRERRVG